MDRLLANGRLYVDDEMVSSNGWFTLRMFSDGALALYRTQVNQTMWVSPLLGRPGGMAIMQTDGNFVTYAPDGTPYWATNTDGHPGAWLKIQDDGNLVVYSATNRALWASNTVIDTSSPTIIYADPGGYVVDETSESWKEMCRDFPCFWALQWPGYATDVIEDTINGQAVVIQLWKGSCPKFLGFLGVQDFPGGVGAEVGVYRRIPGKSRAIATLANLVGDFSTKMASALVNLADNELWWPFPELGARIEMRLLNPATGQSFISAGPQRGYWLTKWMHDSSYRDYQRDHGGPTAVTDWVLDYTINGKHYPQWPVGPTARRVASQAASDLLLLT